MINTPILSYGFSHHLFHQAAELSHHFPDARVATSSFVPEKTVRRAARFSPRLGTYLARRSHPAVPTQMVKTYTVEQWWQIGARLLKRPYSYFAAHDRMARRITRDFNPPKVLLAVDTGAESLFRIWGSQTTRILDLTIAVPQYREHIFRAAAADPANAGVEFHYPGQWEIDRYATEVAAADLILCPSEFVRDSCLFLGTPAEKLRILPYGFDPARFTPRDQPANIRGPFQVLFAGLFCHRKGSHLLLPAFERLRNSFPDAELHVFGEVMDRPARLPNGVTLHGRIPQSELAAKFRSMDVMAFPTLFEGSAYVAYQAMASGLPVITTRNCGSLVDKTTGHIMPQISIDSLHAALVDAATNRAQWHQRGQQAATKVREYSWQHYGDRLKSILQPFLD